MAHLDFDYLDFAVERRCVVEGGKKKSHVVVYGNVCHKHFGDFGNFIYFCI